MESKLDIVAVGDIVTDAFIRLKEAEVHCDINREKCQICLRFGDKIPYESVDVVAGVGNSANAAVAAARLGLKSALLSDIGNDESGKRSREVLEQEKVITDYITTHEGFVSNYHYVLWYHEERTILIKHQEYPYRLPHIPEPRWMYLSSLAPNSLAYHKEISDYLLSHTEVRLAFQPGTFQIKLGFEALRNLYERSEVFFCNVEEARLILNLSGDEPITKLLEGIRKLGPKISVITDGPKGAYAFDGETMWHMPMYPDPKPPFERTGAGDAFSSTFIAALALGKSIPDALMWGPVNSMTVVQQVGAQKGLLTRAQLEVHLAKAPDEYQPTVINQKEEVPPLAALEPNAG